MIELRWNITEKDRTLQYRILLQPCLIAGGDIVLRPSDIPEAQWQDVPDVFSYQVKSE